MEGTVIYSSQSLSREIEISERPLRTKELAPAFLCPAPQLKDTATFGKQCSTDTPYLTFFFFFFNFYLFMIVTERERERGRDTGGGRSRLHAPGA